MNYITTLSLPKLLFAFALAGLAMVPATTNAAEVEPVCIMLLKTTSGTVVAQGTSEVMLNKGEELQIFWFSANATTAENRSGNSVPLTGRTVKSPTAKTTYTYTFSKGAKEVECSVIVHPVEGKVTASTLSSLSTTPTFSGTVSGSKTVSVKIFKDGTNTLAYKSGTISVVDGVWKHKVTSALARGSYDFVLYGDDNLKLNTISKRTLTIGTAAAADTGGSTLVVQSIPLLAGGVAKKNQTVGLSYLQVLNVGLKSATVTGIRIKQTGSASTDAVLSLMAIDDTELAKGQVGKIGTSPFKSGEALIPISLTLKPKETRLFTIKATMASDVSDYVGDTLKMVVSGVDSQSSVKGAFPIRGVTWTISQ